ncbi:hypothetical protein SDC9_141489 [bioreactor metagenome]|uniref:Uncharacterized protein n=1 Tax=bioreactor metagenome TaxID=1076179 RepID=A0A645E0G0_9ZZZZ
MYLSAVLPSYSGDAVHVTGISIVTGCEASSSSAPAPSSCSDAEANRTNAVNASGRFSSDLDVPSGTLCSITSDDSSSKEMTSPLTSIASTETGIIPVTMITDNIMAISPLQYLLFLMSVPSISQVVI